MSSKLGLILSMFFFSLFFLLSIDVVFIQYFYNDLDHKGISIGYEISKCMEISDDFIASLEEKYHITISDISSKEPDFGDVVNYTIQCVYHPLIVSRNDMKITVQRSTVIGYY